MVLAKMTVSGFVLPSNTSAMMFWTSAVRYFYVRVFFKQIFISIYLKIFFFIILSIVVLSTIIPTVFEKDRLHMMRKQKNKCTPPHQKPTVQGQILSLDCPPECMYEAIWRASVGSCKVVS